MRLITHGKWVFGYRLVHRLTSYVTEKYNDYLRLRWRRWFDPTCSSVRFQDGRSSSVCSVWSLVCACAQRCLQYGCADNQKYFDSSYENLEILKTSTFQCTILIITSRIKTAKINVGNSVLVKKKKKTTSKIRRKNVRLIS